MGAWQGIKDYVRKGRNGILQLFYPHTCAICHRVIDDRHCALCTTCEEKLPRTEHAWNRDNDAEIIVAKERAAHAIERGGSFCFYRKGTDFQQLIHRLKYASLPHIGIYLGRLAAQEFDAYGFFEGIDYLVPVPLHPHKEKQRGYNQAEMICLGMAEVLHLPIDTSHLCRIHNNASQTRKTKVEREEATQHIFALTHPEHWRGKHILLVDDILTTGATLRACINATRGVRGIHISIFTLGMVVFTDFEKFL